MNKKEFYEALQKIRDYNNRIGIIKEIEKTYGVELLPPIKPCMVELRVKASDLID